MIRIQHLSQSYGDQVLFRDVSLTIGEQERIGLIGRNGSGKSTFLRMLLDRSDDRDGAIQTPSSLVISSLEQNLDFTEPTLLQQVSTALRGDHSTDLWKVQSILMGLGFSEADFEKAPGDFSSGFQIRIRLAEALVAEPHLLLLDEPTNYLDILSLRWLERFLSKWKGSFILVTHDRCFMERVVTHVIGIHRGKMRKMKGGPQKLTEQIEMDEDVYERTRQKQVKKQKKTEEFISKFRAGARSAGLVQSRIKSLEKQDIGEKLAKIATIQFTFHTESFRGNDLLKVHNLNFGYEPEKRLVTDFSLSVRPGERLAIIGRNGKGKSTLLRLLAGRLEAETGKRKEHPELKLGYFGSDSKEELMPAMSILEELRKVPRIKEQEIRNLCGSLLFSGKASEKKISQLSGGEKSRVCLGKVMLRQSNLLMLDEPTNHLDMESCDALIESLRDYDGTVIFVSHDENMLSQLATRLILFDRGKIQVLDQTYDEFLASGGWSEEEDEGIFKFAKADSDNKKQYLARKEAQKKERMAKSRMKKVEAELEELETKKSEAFTALNQAYEEKDQEGMKTLGKQVKELSESIDGLYEELEELMESVSSAESP